MTNGIYIIGEVGQAHEGSIALAHAYIDALKYAGVNAVKFQMHIADAESSPHEDFRIPIAYHSGSRAEYWKRMEFTRDEWAGLKAHCEKNGLDFIASPFSMAAADILEELGVSKFKVASGETENYLMLDKLAATCKELIISTGMSSWVELDELTKHLRSQNARFSLLQCTTAYPAETDEWGLNVIAELKSRYGVTSGYSDHSGSIFACLAATALGAEILEFHVTFNRRMQGPDALSSITIDEAKLMIAGIREIEGALNSEVDKTRNAHFTDLKTLFGKSLAVNKPMRRGQQISEQDLESKKPAGYGISSKHYQQVLGKTLTKDMAQWEFLTENDLDHA